MVLNLVSSRVHMLPQFMMLFGDSGGISETNLPKLLLFSGNLLLLSYNIIRRGHAYAPDSSQFKANHVLIL